MKRIVVVVMLSSIVACSGTLYGQEKKSRKQLKAEQAQQTEMMVKQLIDAQKYIFTGTNTLATGDERYQPHHLIVTKERIETSFLPQYSKNSTLVQNGVFSFYDEFEYQVENSKKGGWDIYIKIEIEWNKIAYEMFLKVHPNGSASLRLKTLPASSSDSKTFTGNISAPKPSGRF